VGGVLEVAQAGDREPQAPRAVEPGFQSNPLCPGLGRYEWPRQCDSDLIRFNGSAHIVRGQQIKLTYSWNHRTAMKGESIIRERALTALLALGSALVFNSCAGTAYRMDERQDHRDTRQDARQDHRDTRQDARQDRLY
jgi:hypothetical protein